MTTTYHTPIVTGNAANASVINAPLGQLDAAIAATVAAAATQNQVVADAVNLGGSAVTLANGAASAGQKVVTVDDATIFVAGARVEYALAGGVIEYNTVGTVNSGTQITLSTNIGTGGIANDTPVSAVPAGLYSAKAGTYNVMDYGATGNGGTDDTAAIQAALTAASLTGGEVYLAPGSYLTTATLNLAAHVHLRGALGEGSGGGARILPNAKTFAAITITGPALNWSIENLIIDYGSESSASSAIGINLVSSGGNPCLFTIDRVHIYAAYRGIVVPDGSIMYSIRNCLIQTVYNCGVYIAGGTTATLEDVYVQIGRTQGFNISNVSGLVMINCATDMIGTSGAPSTTHINQFSTCFGSILGFFVEKNYTTGAGNALGRIVGGRLFIQGWNGNTNTFSATGSYTSNLYISDNAQCIIMGAYTHSDVVSAGDHYVTFYASDAVVSEFGCTWGTPAGGTQYWRVGQSHVWKDGVYANGIFQNFSANDATPSVAAGNLFKTANANNTTITAFDGGMAGQTIRVIVNDAKTTIDFSGTTLKGNAGADWSPASGDWLEATYDGSNWYCSCHDCTA